MKSFVNSIVLFFLAMFIVEAIPVPRDAILAHIRQRRMDTWGMGNDMASSSFSLPSFGFPSGISGASRFNSNYPDFAYNNNIFG
uniref:Uncharacterized protein n=1 Tax=Acrobeloides nanus TaxID=290746 RepID=A0A914D9S0_9BILA